MRRQTFLAAWAVLVSISMAPVPLPAQQQQPSAEAGSLSPDELTGKKFFLQRCSICHLPQQPAPQRSYGPPLDRLFAGGATSATETRVREVIRRGGPSGMPGFQYGLEPAEINQIIAYLKTRSTP